MTPPGNVLSLCALSAGLFFSAIGIRAQDIPAVNVPPSSPGFQLPRTAGTLRYSVGGSESTLLGYQGANQNVSSFSVNGNLAYLSSSTTEPFSLVYSGGFFVSLSGQPSSVFQSLSASQVLALKRWKLTLSDQVSYLPQAPSVGLAGIPGMGDLGVAPPVDGQGDGLQSNYSPQVNNVLTASLSRSITGKTSVSGMSSIAVLRFVNSDRSGIPTDLLTVGASASHALSGKTSFSASYNYSLFNYPSYDLSYRNHGASVSWIHQWSRALSTSLGAGPQYTQSASSGGSLNYSVNAGATYAARTSQLSATFARSVSNGSGITLLTRNSQVSLNGTRRLGPFSSVSAVVSYVHAESVVYLPQFAFSADSVVGSLQFSRSLTRTLSGYASYTAQRQTSANTVFAVNNLNGLAQTLGFGITYSPRPFILGR